MTDLRGQKPLGNPAECEHAWLLRIEGLKLREIGERLGLSKDQVRMRIAEFCWKMQWAMQRTKIYFLNDPARTKLAKSRLNQQLAIVAEQRRQRWEAADAGKVK